MSVNKRIKDGRIQLGLKEEAFAKLCGVTRGTVQQWEKEGGTAPNRSRQPIVADVLSLSVAQLMSGNADTKEGPKIGGYVPILSNVQAGAFKEYVDNFHPGDGGQEEIATTVPVKRHTFALRVSGDSMHPDFTEGMVLIVEPEMEPNTGDFVIAKNADGESTFKKLVNDGGDWYLKPMNNAYPMKPLGRASILGVVRAVERRFR